MPCPHDKKDQESRERMSNKVRIYRPAKNAMQSGRANTRQWIVESTPASAKEIDSLMGWTGSSDMDSQVKLRFASKEDAVAYADRNNLIYEIDEPKERKLHPKNYSDNFSPNRLY